MAILDRHTRGVSTDPTELIISSVQPDRDHALLTVTGWLVSAATAELAQRVEGLLIGGARYLVVDLSQAQGVHPEVIALLSATGRRLTADRGWLKLSGVGPAVLEELDEASLPDLFALYQAAIARDGRNGARSGDTAQHRVA